MEELGNLITYRCPAEGKEKLLKPVTEQEIKEVLFSMPNDKSPGPDGYTTEFYKATWDILGVEFVVAVQSFFAKGFFLKESTLPFSL